MKYLIMLIAIILFANCSSNENCKINYFKKFPITEEVIHEEIKTPSILYMVGGMILTDSVLITMDLKADTIFQVFRLQDLSYRGGFILRGRGPNEEVTVSPFFRTLERNKFLYRAHSSLKIAEFNPVINKIDITKRINLPGKLLDFFHVFNLGTDNYYGYNKSIKGDNEIIGYNSITNKTFEFGGKYPKLDKKMNNMSRNRLTTKCFSIKPDKTHFASIYDKFPILRIYSKEGNLVKEVRHINGQDFPIELVSKRISESKLENVMQNYMGIKSTNKYIYALYVGKTQKEIKLKSSNNLSNILHVFDWEGNPIKEIVLDKDIFSYVVSYDDSYILCSCIDQIDKLYKFNISEKYQAAN